MDENETTEIIAKAVKWIAAIIAAIIVLPIFLVTCGIGPKTIGYISYGATIPSHFKWVCLGKKDALIYAVCDTGIEKNAFTKYNLVYSKVYGRSIFSPFRPKIDALEDSIFLIGFTDSGLFINPNGIESENELGQHYDFPVQQIKDFKLFTPTDTIFLPDAVVDTSHVIKLPTE